MTNRVHIDAPAGIIDLEGEKDFVEGMLTKLFPLVEEAGFGCFPPNAQTPKVTSDGSDSLAEESSNKDLETPKKRARKPVKQPPAGQSCPARIQVLKDEGFFKKKQGGADIVEALQKKGWIHNLNQVGAATSALFNKGVLQRTKDGSGPWQYFWDRE